MSDPELEAAMRLGDKSPLDQRSKDDLGRFGMGLKTASFSQCRSLTVTSRKQGASESCLRWDLDEIAKRDDGAWVLFEGVSLGSEARISPLEEQLSGTLVLWEKLDRIVTDGFNADHFLKMIDGVETKLSMIFHRLLEGKKPLLTLYINKVAINPWDPFLIDHPAKPWNSPVEKRWTLSGDIEVECHVLPHKDMLSLGEYENAAGPDGWNSQQGFYVYRNKRLLLAGGWLGLGDGRVWNREEAQKLARIRLDIPNTSDMDWKIDIRKATARIPVNLRPWLTKLADDTRNRARKVFAFRGVPTPGVGGVKLEQAWRVEHLKDGVKYKVDTTHPAVAAVFDSAGELLPLIKAMLRVVEETVPVQKIWLDTAETKNIPLTGFENEPPSDVMEILEILYEDMITRRCMSKSLAKKTLLSTEPFQKYPSFIAGLPDD